MNDARVRCSVVQDGGGGLRYGRERGRESCQGGGHFAEPSLGRLCRKESKRTRARATVQTAVVVDARWRRPLSTAFPLRARGVGRNTPTCRVRVRVREGRQAGRVAGRSVGRCSARCNTVIEGRKARRRSRSARSQPHIQLVNASAQAD